MSENSLVILQMVNYVFQFLMFILVVYNMVAFIWILSSWLPVNRSIAILRFVDNLINPVYYTLLRVLPPLRLGMMDFSPFYLFLLLMVLENLINILHRLVLTGLINLFG